MWVNELEDVAKCNCWSTTPAHRQPASFSVRPSTSVSSPIHSSYALGSGATLAVTDASATICSVAADTSAEHYNSNPRQLPLSGSVAATAPCAEEALNRELSHGSRLQHFPWPHISKEKEVPWPPLLHWASSLMLSIDLARRGGATFWSPSRQGKEYLRCGYNAETRWREDAVVRATMAAVSSTSRRRSGGIRESSNEDDNRIAAGRENNCFRPRESKAYSGRWWGREKNGIGGGLVGGW